jgi:hypothetical protein
MRMRRNSAALVVALPVLLLLPASAAGEERTCRGTIGATTVDNLRVPQGETCVLEGTRLQGTAKVERDAVLRAKGVRVIGNVQGENAQRVKVVQDSKVGGSVQVVQGDAAKVADSRIKGDILYDENSGPLRVLRSRVGEDVQAFQNTGGVRIEDNVIDGNLQCKANNPPPTGGGNIVHGNKEDQCASL